MSDPTFGKFRLIAELGHGGMADVFLAVIAGPAGSGFRKLTVIKRLRANLAEDPDFISMLVDEARIAARLNHPNVVQTNEVGQVGDHYFMAMEYLDGQPLHRIQYRSAQARAAGREGGFSEALSLVTLVDTLSGLAHAHDAVDYNGSPLQIVHRDVTPHNIFVTYEGQVKVVDFGIAKAAGRASETRQGVIKGKIRYMAPEQALGAPIDRRADIFSVGVMLWEAAAGRRLWDKMDDIAILTRLASGEMPSLRDVRPDVPEALVKMCDRALALEPADRYPTAEAFRSDLEQYLAETGALVDARRRLGPAVATLFADKRAEMRVIVERQLAALDTRPSVPIFAIPSSTDSRLSAHSIDGSGPPSMQLGAHGTTRVSGRNTADSAVTTSVEAVENEASPKPRRFGAIGVAAMAIVAVAALGVWRASIARHATSTSHDVAQPQGSASGASAMPDDSTPAPTLASADPSRDDPPNAAPTTSAPDPHSASPKPAVVYTLPFRPGQPVTTHVAPTPQSSVVRGGSTSASPPVDQPTPAPAPPPAAPPPTIATPAPAPAPAPTVPAGFVDPKGVRATIRAHAGEVQACYDRARMETPDLGGVVAISATIDPSGNVLAANITNATARQPRLLSCLIGAFRSWHFPAPAGGVNGSVAYNFKFD